MLNKNAEKVLKRIIKKFDGNFDNLIDISHNDFKSEKFSNSLIDSICSQLKNEGYIGYLHSSCDEDDYISLMLEHKGYSYFENKRTQNFRTWTPIIISLIALIKSFLPELTCLMKSIVQLLKALKVN